MSGVWSGNNASAFSTIGIGGTGGIHVYKRAALRTDCTALIYAGRIVPQRIVALRLGFTRVAHISQAIIRIRRSGQIKLRQLFQGIKLRNRIAGKFSPGKARIAIFISRKSQL